MRAYCVCKSHKRTIAVALAILAVIIVFVAGSPVEAADYDDYVFNIDENGKLTGFSSEANGVIDVIVPYGVTSIGNRAFSAMGDYRLLSVTLPETVTSIEGVAFALGVRYLVIPPSVTDIAANALFDGMGVTLKNYILIICEEGSAAHRYAKENGFAFSLGLPDYTIPNNPTVRQIPANRRSEASEFDNTDSAYDFSLVSDIQTVVSPDGSISVMDTLNATIYEFSKDMELLRTQAFDKELKQIGAFTKDKQGNYYIFYAQEVAEGKFNENNMALVKYAPDGSKVKEIRYRAQTYGEKFSGGASGVKKPFRSGNCRMEISGNMLAVYFAREMFAANDGLNHQSSYGFIWDLPSLERLTGKAAEAWEWDYDARSASLAPLDMPTISHSFNQFILPVEGGFVFVDHGDANPRAFAFEKVVPGRRNQQIAAFRFPGGHGENFTGAVMGELAKTKSGYLFCGSYNQYEGDHPYNLFLLTVNEALTSVSDPFYLTNNTTSRGSRYGSENLTAPKLTQIGEDKFLVLWQEIGWGGGMANPRTFMCIVDGKGKVQQATKELVGAALNLNDVIRYNPVTKKVVWAKLERGSSSVEGGSIQLYAFDPFTAPHYAPPEPPPPPAEPLWPVAGGVKVVLNGQIMSFDVPPQIVNGRTMVPLRAIFEEMGAEIVWDDATKTVTATKDGTVVILTVGDVAPTVNGAAVALDQPGIIVDGRTLAPLRFVAEAFGGTVEWDGTTRTAIISK